MPISTHILDTALGRPAAAVPVTLEALEAGGWRLLSRARTDADGRCTTLLPEERKLTPGLYRIHFDTAAYYASIAVAGLYPSVEITFEVRAGEAHYHIPLLLTPNAYTTYRGS